MDKNSCHPFRPFDAATAPREYRTKMIQIGCGDVKREKDLLKWSQDQKKSSPSSSKFSSLKREYPKIICPASADLIDRICLNHKCKNSFRCSELGCNMCGKGTDPLCNSVQLDQITEMIHDRIQACKDIMRGVCDNEEYQSIKFIGL